MKNGLNLSPPSPEFDVSKFDFEVLLVAMRQILDKYRRYDPEPLKVMTFRGIPIKQNVDGQLEAKPSRTDELYKLLVRMGVPGDHRGQQVMEIVHTLGCRGIHDEKHHCIMKQFGINVNDDGKLDFTDA